MRRHRSALRVFGTSVLFVWPLAIHAQRAAAVAVAPYLDQSLTFEQRARDLVSRMSLDEKVAQMNDVAPTIPRLGVPEYNWWNEALHGVARSGLATVFPQAIGLAATWNDSLMLRVATVISDEARAKYHDYIAPRQPSALSGPHVLVAQHQPVPRSASGAGDRRRTARIRISPARWPCNSSRVCRATIRSI